MTFYKEAFIDVTLSPLCDNNVYVKHFLFLGLIPSNTIRVALVAKAGFR